MHLYAGIIGAGRISTEHIKAYQSSGVMISAITSRTKKGARTKAEEVGFNPHYAYNSVDEMFEKHQEINIVSVCSPPEFHKEHIIKAARAGKHIVIEKPAVLNKEELAEVDREINNVGVKSLVCFVLRWNDFIRNLKRGIKEYLGEIFYIEVDYWNGVSFLKPKLNRKRESISTFLSGGCHAVDMVQFLLDDEIIEVKASCPFSQSKEIQRTTSALVKFRSGMVGKISASDEVYIPYCFRITILGSDGAVISNEVYAKILHSPKYMPIEGSPPKSGEVSEHLFQSMIRDFVVSVRHGSSAECSFRNCINTHLTCFAAEESAKSEGSKIIIPQSHKELIYI